MSINIEEFAKVEIRIGTVLEAEKVPDADRLIQLIFDFGPMPEVIANEVKQSNNDDSSLSVQNDKKENQSGKIALLQAPRNEREVERLPELAEKYPGRDVRQIMSAIASFYPDPEVLVGKQIAVCVNLEPRKFRGYKSQGMIMATDTPEGEISLLIPEKKVESGAKIH